jgi:hypothetical protein
MGVSVGCIDMVVVGLVSVTPPVGEMTSGCAPLHPVTMKMATIAIDETSNDFMVHPPQLLQYHNERITKSS